MRMAETQLKGKVSADTLGRYIGVATSNVAARQGKEVPPPEQLAMLPGATPEKIKDARERWVPALGQYANTAQDAKYLKETGVDFDGFSSRIDQLIQLRSGSGRELLPTESAAIQQQLAADLRLDMAKMKNLGVLSESDIENFLDPILESDPSAVMQFNTVSRLKNLQSQYANRYESIMKNYGIVSNKARRHTGLDLKKRK